MECGLLFIMGVTSLGELLKTCPGAIEELTDDQLRERLKGKRCVFDVSGFMHRYVHRCNSLENQEHLKCFMRLVDRMKSWSVVAAFMFDGQQTMAKRDEVNRRKQQQQRSQARAKQNLEKCQQEIGQLQQLIDTAPPPGAKEDQKTVPLPLTTAGGDSVSVYEGLLRVTTLQEMAKEQQKKATRSVRSEDYEALRKMFDQAKVPYFTAAYEAEQAATWMVRHGLADVVISDDYDCLACGAPFFLQHFNSSVPNRRQRLIHLQPVLDHQRWTHQEFVDFCILTGTDFGGHIKGIGWKGAEKIIHQHRSIDAFLKSKDINKYRSRPDQTVDTFQPGVARAMLTDDSFPLVSVHNCCCPSPVHEGGPFAAVQAMFDAESQHNPLLVGGGKGVSPTEKKRVIKRQSPPLDWTPVTVSPGDLTRNATTVDRSDPSDPSSPAGPRVNKTRRIVHL